MALVGEGKIIRSKFGHTDVYVNFTEQFVVDCRDALEHKGFSTQHNSSKKIAADAPIMQQHDKRFQVCVATGAKPAAGHMGRHFGLPESCCPTGPATCTFKVAPTSGSRWGTPSDFQATKCMPAAQAKGRGEEGRSIRSCRSTLDRGRPCNSKYHLRWTQQSYCVRRHKMRLALRQQSVTGWPLPLPGYSPVADATTPVLS